MSFNIITASNGMNIKVWNSKVTIESGALDQARELALLPITKAVALMPDAHVGAGACVGSVVQTINAVIPSSVGVDIGCGMVAARLSLKASQLPDDLKAIRGDIEDCVPVGFDEHTSDRLKKRANKDTKTLLNKSFNNLSTRLDVILQKHPGIEKIVGKVPTHKKAWSQLGSLGGGNHFIELCIDESDDVWVMLHSGSRKIGNAIGTYFIEKAKKEMERLQQHLPNKELAYLVEGSLYYNDYVEALHWAQDYAKVNRDVMMNLVINSLSKTLPPFEITSEVVNCHHNYVETTALETNEIEHITRKGAVSAKDGELGIIPGSMGAKSYIVRGKGNSESMCSCSHGAGRQMSRGQANKLITLEQHYEDTAGVECRKDRGVLDESPRAYKDIELVMESQQDLVEVVHTLKQVLCVKG